MCILRRATVRVPHGASLRQTRACPGYLAHRTGVVTAMGKKPSYEELERRLVDLENTKSEHRKLEERLEDEIAWRRMLVEQSRDGIVVLDRDCKVFEANRRYADMLGYTMDEVRNLYVWDWDFLFPKEKLIEMIRSVDAEGDHFETRHHRKDGTVIDVEISTNGAVYKGQKLVFCVCRDITERKRSEAERERLILEIKEMYRQLEKLSITDALTGLFNRRLFDMRYVEEIHRARRNGTEISLLMIDIDDFKKINDIHGHLCGDRCLFRLATDLRKILKRASDFLARYGGEEFVAILPETGLSAATRLAERIREAAEKLEIRFEGDTIRLTVSIGVASCVFEDFTMKDSLLSRADDALYQAKARGKNRVVVAD